MVAVRYDRFNAGLLATLLYNSRPNVDPVEVWDFIPGMARDEADIEADKLRRSIRQGVVIAFSRMQNMPIERIRREARDMVKRMEESGTTDAEAIVSEAFEDVIRHSYAE